jgi:enhancing lycopene biosynthesis protein 2
MPAANGDHPKVALVLSGCGVFDGSEIHEAVSCLIHLSRAGAEVSCFAPDIQAPAVNHLTGQPEPAPRNVLAESARIARGKIAPLSQLRVADFDAVVFPGGFGAAKNLCDFATRGAKCEVNPEVERIIKEFHGAGKPVGMCCIAPVLAAKVLGTAAGGPGVEVTIGDDAGAAAAVAEMGSRNVVRTVTEAHADDRNAVVTAPAYMYGQAAVHEVYEGIGRMIEGVLARIGAPAR